MTEIRILLIITLCFQLLRAHSQPIYDDLIISISPDGKRMLFCSTRGDFGVTQKSVGFRQSLYISNVDGSGLRKFAPLPDSVIYYGNAAFVHDSKNIAFTARIGKYTQVVISDIFGKKVKQLTNSKGNNSNVSVSRDGKTLLYTSSLGKWKSIYKYDLRFDKETKLTTDTVSNDFASFSQNGKEIIFSSNREGNFQIYVMNADGTNVRRITNGEAHYEAPQWSPDGRKIVCTKRVGTVGSVIVMDENAANEVVISSHTSRFAGTANGKPAWYPDGKSVYYHRLEDNKHFRIYRANSDGSGKKVITVE